MYERKDYYYRKAKKKGYRARSAYKLKEVQRKYKIIKKKDNVLDIGCAPGGWLQVAKKITSGKVVGVDLVDIKPIEGVIFILGDIRDDIIQKKINEQSKVYDVVLSDVAPKTTGNKERDQYVSFELSRMSLQVAKKVLKKGGNFLVKTFQSGDTEELLQEMKKRFSFVKVYNPKSTRMRSKEIYIVAMGFKE